MAPELLTNQGNDYLADYWAVGCILFELLAGTSCLEFIYLFIYF